MLWHFAIEPRQLLGPHLLGGAARCGGTSEPATQTASSAETPPRQGLLMQPQFWGERTRALLLAEGHSNCCPPSVISFAFILASPRPRL